jgi:hypothetical protein
MVRGQSVLSTHKPNSPNVIGFTTLDRGLFTGWRPQSLTYPQNVFGDQRTYSKSFADREEHKCWPEVSIHFNGTSQSALEIRVMPVNRANHG